MARKSMAELLADLAAQFPDNTTGLITPAIVRSYFTDIINAIRPAYAILERQLAVVQAVTTVDTPLVFTSADTTPANGEFTANASAGQVGRIDKGTTRFTFTADYLSPSNSARTLTFTIYRGGVPTVWAQSVTLTANTITESVTFDALVNDPTATDYSMRVKSTVSENITFSNMALVAEVLPVNAY